MRGRLTASNRLATRYSRTSSRVGSERRYFWPGSFQPLGTAVGIWIPGGTNPDGSVVGKPVPVVVAGLPASLVVAPPSLIATGVGVVVLATVGVVEVGCSGVVVAAVVGAVAAGGVADEADSALLSSLLEQAASDIMHIERAIARRVRLLMARESSTIGAAATMDSTPGKPLLSPVCALLRP